MGKTIAEDLMEKGKEQGKLEQLQEVLLRLMQNRFGKLPRKVVQIVNRTPDRQKLELWVDRTQTAATLADMQIEPRS
jgi:hypothetical protein